MLGVCLTLITEECDKVKFEDLYYQYKDLSAYICGKYLSSGDIDDAVNEVFFRIAKNFSKFTDKSAEDIKRYLVIISRNVALNYCAIKEKHNAVSLESQIETPSSDNEIEYWETKNIYVEALNKLPQRHYDVLYLVIKCHMNASEVADFMMISKAAAYKRIQTAKDKLKKLVEEGDIDEN